MAFYKDSLPLKPDTLEVWAIRLCLEQWAELLILQDPVVQYNSGGLCQPPRQECGSGAGGFTHPPVGRMSCDSFVCCAHSRHGKMSDYLSHLMLDQGEWSLDPNMFRQVCLWWGTQNLDRLASTGKVPKGCGKGGDPLADAINAYVG